MAGPMLVAARLWKRTSEKTGRTYLAGRLGGVRVLVMARSDRDSDAGSDHSHELLFAEAAPATARQASTPEVNGAAAPSSRSRARRASHSGQRNHRIEDDPVPF
jgi:hypothetical protein